MSGGLQVDLRVERASPGGEAFLLDAAFEGSTGITVVFGASGAGKSTLLLSILGAIPPHDGRIGVAGRLLYDSTQAVDLPTVERRVGIVFQDALLFPHLDVRRNVAFGVTGPGRDRRVQEMLEQVGAVELAGRRPDELSGGQRQRVALARALAARPAALLLDEPFSALDARARENLGETLGSLQRESGVPFVHVTHDLGEALRLGDRLVLLEAGRVLQVGPPADVVASPASVEAAHAVGTGNLFRGTVVATEPAAGCTEVDLGGTRILVGRLDLSPGAEVTLGLRAEEALLSLEALAATSARNVLPGTVRELVPRGPLVEARIETPVPFRVIVTPASVTDLRLEPGRRVHLLIKATAFHHLK